VPKSEDKAQSALPAAAMSRQQPTDDNAVQNWPTLMSCLYPIWVDGKCKRQSGSLKIRLVGGYYVVTLSCPTEGMEASLTTDTLVDLFDALEARVSDPACVWTPDFAAVKRTRQIKIESVK